MLHDRGKKTGCQVDAPACGRGGGGIMRLWKHEGKEKKEEDGTKGRAYRMTPQRL